MKKTNFLRSLWYGLPVKQRFQLRKLYYLPIDLWDKITGKTEKYVAPRGAIYTGSPAGAKEYLEQGQHQLSILRQHLALKPEDTILDVGSGIGRTAVALSGYLNSTGRYEGFDAVKEGVDWCQKKISRDFANFHFRYIPLNNDLYNDSGLDAAQFVFPYEAGAFDKVFLFSVFTHMQLPEIQNYLKEIERVLKPGGRCLATLFVYGSNNEDYISNHETFGFPVLKAGYRLMNEKIKGSNIAISENKLAEIIGATGLGQTNFIPGFWKDASHDPDKSEYQDILVLEKPKS